VFWLLVSQGERVIPSDVRDDVGFVGSYGLFLFLQLGVWQGKGHLCVL
jgi:hypothetical protein